MEDGVLARGNTNTTTLDSIQVDDSGFIFIPYAGRVKASGNSPDRLRQIITEKLSDLTPEPQVVVERAPGDAATVSILGNSRRINRTFAGRSRIAVAKPQNWTFLV